MRLHNMQKGRGKAINKPKEIRNQMFGSVVTCKIYRGCAASMGYHLRASVNSGSAIQ